MSIFAKIRSSKKAAEEHKAQKAASDAAEATKPAPAPYHHIPKHAAQDAIVGAPGTADKQAIREANRQRTMYAGRDSFYSSASPSLSRLGSEAGSVRGATTAGNSRSSSRVRPPLQDRRSHPGYSSYQNLSLTTQERRSRANSRHANAAKSPLSSEPITPRDSSAASSASTASSFSSVRSYTDPITPSAPFSERLETISSAHSVRSVKTPLYTPQAELRKPKPWEVAAAKKAKAAVNVEEITKPEPAVTKRGRFMSIGRKQPVQVAAC